MNAKNQKPNLRSEKIQSTSFLIWIISGLYLLPMVWFLLSTMGGYGAHETKPWLVPTVAAQASDILRHCGVELGKRDFIGAI